MELKRCCQFFQSQRIERAPAVDVGFRAHHGHALLKAEPAMGGAREQGVNGGRGKGSAGCVQVELGTRTLLQEGREGNVPLACCMTKLGNYYTTCMHSFGGREVNTGA